MQCSKQALRAHVVVRQAAAQDERDDGRVERARAVDEAQLEAEGIKIPFKYILSEAVFCGNALLAVNDSTPYNAVYGRVPRVLPSIDQIQEPNSSIRLLNCKSIIQPHFYYLKFK